MILSLARLCGPAAHFGIVRDVWDVVSEPMVWVAIGVLIGLCGAWLVHEAWGEIHRAKVDRLLDEQSEIIDQRNSWRALAEARGRDLGAKLEPFQRMAERRRMEAERRRLEAEELRSLIGASEVKTIMQEGSLKP